MFKLDARRSPARLTWWSPIHLRTPLAPSDAPLRELLRSRVAVTEGPEWPQGGHTLVSDEVTEDLVNYFTFAFGPNSPKPASPEDHPQYSSLVRPVSPNALNIVYVEYDFPAELGMGPWSAVEDKDGKLWIPYYGKGNSVVKLDPKTAVAA